MGFSIWNPEAYPALGSGRSGHSTRLSHVLKIAAKTKAGTSLRHGYAYPQPVPNADQGRAEIEAKLVRILTQHPEFSYALFYDKKSNLFVSRTQPGRDSDPNFCGRSQEAIKMAASWIPLEASHTATKVRLAMEKEDEPVLFDGGWMLTDNQHIYWNLGYFIPPDVPKDRVELGFVSLDED